MSRFPLRRSCAGVPGLPPRPPSRPSSFPLGPLVLLLLPLLLPACQPPATEILWDTYGVPHIFSESRTELFQAQGWAQMESHGNLILRLYGQARGRASEYWGEEYLESDLWVRTHGIPERGEAWYVTQDEEMYECLEAFVEGMNVFARENPEALAQEVRVVLPVEPGDVMAHYLRAIHYTFVSSPGLVPSRLRRSQMDAMLGEAPEGTVEGTPSAPGVPGSNAWAVGPGRSASGHAMLLANPHLPWEDLFLWHEVQLAGPDFDAYGATLVGMPLVTVGFNDHLGWTHTVNQYDGADLYELTLGEGGYLFGGEVRPFETTVDTLRVRQEDGTLQALPLTVQRSVHGPVVGREEGKAYALRVAGLDRSQVIRQYYDMLSAENLEEFEGAMRALQLPMFTTMYADGEGHIMHLFNGLVPVRGRGDDAYWAGPVPGDVVETLWTDYHPYEDLPRVADPASGWLQNANDHPWTTTLPRPPVMDPDLYPPYMVREFMHLRAHRSLRMLLEDESVSFREMVAYKHSTRVEMADRLLDDLLPLARNRGSEKSRRAARVLEGWDRRTDADSRGAVLFLHWAMALYDQTRRDPWAEGWSLEEPMATPDGLEEPDLALRLLEGAADTTLARHGALNVAFGEVHRLRRDTVDLPANGHGDPLGIFRAAWYEPTADGLTHELTGGDSFVMAVEFGDSIRARAVLGYGNSSQPGSPHRTDQLGLFSEQRMRPVWRTRGAVEANLSHRTLWPLPTGG